MSCKIECGPVSPAQAHCSVCHLTFGGVTVFDRHRKDGQCRTPESLGLELKGSVWRTPAPVGAFAWAEGRSGGGTA